MPQATKKCPHCGAKMVEYRHNFNQSMVQSLRRLAQQDDYKCNIEQIGLTRYQWVNFQKIRYWGLVEKSHDINGERIGGHWNLTRRGMLFLEGKITIPKQVWTYRGEHVRDDEAAAQVRIDQITETKFKKRKDYAEEAQ